jgi:hypothetical protein
VNYRRRLTRPVSAVAAGVDPPALDAVTRTRIVLPVKSAVTLNDEPVAPTISVHTVAAQDCHWRVNDVAGGFQVPLVTLTVDPTCAVP